MRIFGRSRFKLLGCDVTRCWRAAPQGVSQRAAQRNRRRFNGASRTDASAGCKRGNRCVSGRSRAHTGRTRQRCEAPGGTGLTGAKPAPASVKFRRDRESRVASATAGARRRTLALHFPRRETASFSVKGAPQLAVSCRLRRVAAAHCVCGVYWYGRLVAVKHRQLRQFVCSCSSGFIPTSCGLSGFGLIVFRLGS